MSAVCYLLSNYTITLSHRLWYLGVKIYSVRVLAGAELQTWVDSMGGAGVFSIIALIIVISISRRRQTCCCFQVCRETGRNWQISHPVFVLDSLLVFTALLVSVSPLVMQELAETLNSSSFWDLLFTEQYWEDRTFCNRLLYVNVHAHTSARVKSYFKCKITAFCTHNRTGSKNN